MIPGLENTIPLVEKGFSIELAERVTLPYMTNILFYSYQAVEAFDSFHVLMDSNVFRYIPLHVEHSC